MSTQAFLDGISSDPPPREGYDEDFMPLGRGLTAMVVQVDEHRFAAALTVGELLMLTPNPTIVHDPRQQSLDPRLQQIAPAHAEVQRLFLGAKKTNATSYRHYILEGFHGERENYTLPPISLFTPEKITVRRVGNATVASIPVSRYVLPYDGETQTVALREAANEDVKILDMVILCDFTHGKPVSWASQAFHDRNAYGVKPNSSEAMARDEYDAATKLTRKIIEGTFLRGRVSFKRQLGVRETELVTLSALRQGVVCSMLGTSGFAVGSKAVELPKPLSEKRETAIRDTWGSVLRATENWFHERNASVMGSPAVLAAIGVLIYEATQHVDDGAAVDLSVLTEVLARVDWKADLRWDGIAGKIGVRGTLSRGGSKEYGHSVLNALRGHQSRVFKQWGGGTGG